MNFHDFDLRGATLRLLPSGGLWWPDADLLVVSDLHLCKSERVARHSGNLLPPYETRDTLRRLGSDVAATRPRTVICLGDSFDDDAARRGLGPDDTDALSRLQAGRRWVWITGNHDPALDGLAGTICPEFVIRSVIFRHIATVGHDAEISGHYHPKACLKVRGKAISRPCCLHDGGRAILPAYGTYTGGLDWRSPVFASIFTTTAWAVLTGTKPCSIPFPRQHCA